MSDDFKEDLQEGIEDLKEGLETLANTADTTSKYTQQDISSNKVMAAVSYLGPLWLVPFLTVKESSPFARFHLNQGLLVLILWVLVGIASFILKLLGILGSIISWILWAILGVLMIFGIVMALTGKAKELPLIGGIQILP